MGIFANVAISLDGKLGSEIDASESFSSRADRARMRILREQAHAVLVGAETVRQANPPFGIESPDAQKRRLARGLPAQPAAVLLTQNGRGLEEASRFWGHAGKKIVVTTERGARALSKRALEHDALIIAIPISPDGIDLLAMKDALETLGLTDLLVEGGGKVMASFLRARLVYRLYVTISPCILGGKNAPALFDGPGFSMKNRVRLTLSEVTREADELFLVYETGEAGALPSGGAASKPCG